MAPELKQYQHRRECTAQQRLEEGQKVQQPIVLCSGVQVLFYRPASFGLRLPHLCHPTLERNLGKNSTSCLIPATMESPVALQRSPMNAGFW